MFQQSGTCVVTWNLAEGVALEPTLRIIVQAARQLAVRAGLGKLLLETPVREGSAEAGLLHRLGCEINVSFYFFETDLIRGAEIFRRGRDHLERRGGVPPSARLMPLGEAPQIPVKTLLNEEVGSYATDTALLVDEFHLRHSTVALDGPKVVGAVLMDRPGEIPRVRYMAVSPNYRNSWPYILLMLRSHEQLLAAGFTVVHFKTNPERHPGLRNFARRVQGRELYREHHFKLSL